MVIEKIINIINEEESVEYWLESDYARIGPYDTREEALAVFKIAKDIENG